MNHFIGPAVIVYPVDDDSPRRPDPAEDALASPMARRYIRSGDDGNRPYTVNTETTRPREVVIHAA